MGYTSINWGNNYAFYATVDRNIKNMNLSNQQAYDVLFDGSNTFTLNNKQALDLANNPNFYSTLNRNNNFSYLSDSSLQQKYADLLTKIEFRITPNNAQNFISENGTFTLDAGHFRQIDEAFSGNTYHLKPLDIDSSINPSYLETGDPNYLPLDANWGEPSYVQLDQHQFTATHEQVNKMNDISKFKVQNSAQGAKAPTPFAETPMGIATIVVSAVMGTLLLLSISSGIALALAHQKEKQRKQLQELNPDQPKTLENDSSNLATITSNSLRTAYAKHLQEKETITDEEANNLAEKVIIKELKKEGLFLDHIDLSDTRNQDIKKMIESLVQQANPARLDIINNHVMLITNHNLTTNSTASYQEQIDTAKKMLQKTDLKEDEQTLAMNIYNTILQHQTMSIKSAISSVKIIDTKEDLEKKEETFQPEDLSPKDYQGTSGGRYRHDPQKDKYYILDKDGISIMSEIDKNQFMELIKDSTIFEIQDKTTEQNSAQEQTDSLAGAERTFTDEQLMIDSDKASGMAQGSAN